MTLVYHISDTHGDLDPLLQIPKEADIVLITGDVLPTYGRIISFNNRIVPWVEAKHQNAWLDVYWPRFLKALEGRPCITVQGNHDFTSLAGRGGDVYELTADRPSVALLGRLWAGFPEIPIIRDREWNHETADLRPAIQRVLRLDPDILLTHTPGTVLGDPYPCKPLGAALRRHAGRLTHHFFGHVHESQGVKQVGRVCYVNGSTKGMAHTLKDP